MLANRLPDQLPKLLASNQHYEVEKINTETMANLLQEKYNYQKIVILDCRYDYEYNGGHIRGAVNINKVEELDEMYYNFLNSSKEICFVFYCEFSSIRGPSMFHHFRNLDRKNNILNHPYLDYPESYILSGGYNKFYSEYRHLCSPEGYITMRNPDFMDKLKCLHKLFPSKSKKKKYRSYSLNNIEFLSRSKKKCTSKDLIDSNNSINDSFKGLFDVEFKVHPKVIKFDIDLGGENNDKLMLRASKSMPDILFNLNSKNWMKSIQNVE